MAARTLATLPEPLGFLFLHITLTWLIAGAAVLRKLSSLMLSSKAAPRTQKPKVAAAAAIGHPELRREDVETVLNTLGLYEESGGERLEECCWSVDELSALFEEKEPSLEEVKETFCVFDDGGDGFIDAAELRRVLARLGFAAELDACRRMIEPYDENGDGKIDFIEFVKFMETGFC